MKKFGWMIFVGVVMGYSSQAQIIRIDKMHLNQDSATYWVGAIDAGGNVNNGTVRDGEQSTLVIVNANSDVVWIGQETAWLALGGFQFVRNGGERVLDRGSMHIRSILKRTSKISYEVYGQAQFEENRLMNERLLVGGGLRWNILRKVNTLNIGLGAFWEHEEWKRFETDNVEKYLWKMNSYVSGEIHISERFLITFIGYYQTGYDGEIDRNRNRTSLLLELKEKITKKVRVKLGTDYRYEQDPLIDLNKSVYTSYIGVEWQL